MGKSAGKNIIWGITGPVGAGKTLTAELLVKYGAVNLEVDAVGHAILEDPDIKCRLVEVFGAGILGSDRRVCRTLLGREAFRNEETRKRLDSIMHPPIEKAINDRVNEFRKEKSADNHLLIINAALLYHIKLDRFCEKIIYVRAPADVRLVRLVNSRGWSAERACARLTAQDEEPDNDARVVFIDNDSTLEELSRKVKKLFVRHIGRTASEKC